jgi:hypothetical protein
MGAVIISKSGLCRIVIGQPGSKGARGSALSLLSHNKILMGLARCRAIRCEGLSIDPHGQTGLYEQA